MHQNKRKNHKNQDVPKNQVNHRKNQNETCLKAARVVKVDLDNPEEWMKQKN